MNEPGSPIRALSPRPHLPFTLFTLTVMILLVVPAAVQHGMFMDGTQYACVARNLAEGKGTFWFPFLSPTWSKAGSGSFLEHPPLAYFIQSLFFRVFGDSVFVEKWFSLGLAALCASLIYRTWLLFHHDNDIRRCWWIPLLLWFATPSVFWSFRNNMLENFLAVTVLAAAYFFIRSTREAGRMIPFALAAGAFLFLGSMCKGIPAFFPLAVPVIYWLLYRELRPLHVILPALIGLAVPLLAYALILSFSDEGRNSLLFYVKNRLLSRVETEHTVGNRFTILFWVFTDQLVSFGFVLLTLAAAAKLRLRPLLRGPDRITLFFLITGLSGVVPLCITHVQRAVYFVPAMSFFALGVASWLSPVVTTLIARISASAYRILNWCAGLSFVGALSYSVVVAGGIDRDEDLLRSVHEVAAVTGGNKVIETTSSVYNKWDFHFYLLRYHQVALGGTNVFRGDVVLIPKNEPAVSVDEEAYRKITLTDYDVFFKIAARREP